ncbi:phosphatase RsbU N-terminal domain-containing protein, partial [Glaciimonas sp. Cout2]
MNNRYETYYALLAQAVFFPDPEEALCAAAELGKRFLKEGILPEDYIDIHQSALLRLAQENPELRFIDVV